MDTGVQKQSTKQSQNSEPKGDSSHDSKRHDATRTDSATAVDDKETSENNTIAEKAEAIAKAVVDTLNDVTK